MDVGKVEDASSAPVTGGNMPPEEPISDDGVNYDIYADSPAAHTTPSPETPEINFSSEDIQKREKTNYFVNIKDAEKHQREAERKHDAESRRKLSEVRRAEREAKRAEKAAAKERAKQQNYNSSEEKEAIKKASAEERKHRKLARAERRKQRRLARKVRFAKFIAFLWVGKHKFFTIAAGALLVAGIVVYIVVVAPYLEQQRLAAEERARQEAIKQADIDASHKSTDFMAEIEEAMYRGESFDQCSKRFEDAINGTNSDTEKIHYSIEYANYVYRETDDTNKAIAILMRVIDLPKTNAQKEAYYKEMIYILEIQKNEEAVKYYSDLLSKVYKDMGYSEDIKQEEFKEEGYE